MCNQEIKKYKCKTTSNNIVTGSIRPNVGCRFLIRVHFDIEGVTVPEFKKKPTVIIFKSYLLYLKPFYAIITLYSTLL